MHVCMQEWELDAWENLEYTHVVYFEWEPHAFHKSMAMLLAWATATDFTAWLDSERAALCRIHLPEHAHMCACSIYHHRTSCREHVCPPTRVPPSTHSILDECEELVSLDDDKSVLGYLRRCFEVNWEVTDPNYRLFEPSQSVQLARDIGAAAALLPLEIDDVVSLISFCLQREQRFKQGVETLTERLLEEFQDVLHEDYLMWANGEIDDHQRGVKRPVLWLPGTLDHHYTVILVESWVSGVNFPVGFDATDCTKLAHELGSWPASYREASLGQLGERYPLGALVQ